MLKQKKIPMRMCVVTRERIEKKDLIVNLTTEEKFLKEAISAFADKTSKTSNIFRSIYDIKISYDLTLQIVQAMLFFNEYLNDTKDYVLNYLKQQIEKEG